MPKTVRQFKKRTIDDAKLRLLWKTPSMTVADIADIMGHSPWVLRRRAVKIGLPSSRRTLWGAKI